MWISYRTLKRSLAVISVIEITIVDAFAYLDPGSGSFIVQALIAALAVAALTARYYWKKLTDFLRDPFNRKQGREQEQDEPERNGES